MNTIQGHSKYTFTILYNFKLRESSYLEFAARSGIYQALLGLIEVDDAPDGIEVLE